MRMRRTNEGRPVSAWTRREAEKVLATLFSCYCWAQVTQQIINIRRHGHKYYELDMIHTLD